MGERGTAQSENIQNYKSRIKKMEVQGRFDSYSTNLTFADGSSQYKLSLSL